MSVIESLFSFHVKFHLQVSIIDFYTELGPVDPEHICQGELKSEVMFKEDKKYHIDLKVR